MATISGGKKFAAALQELVRNLSKSRSVKVGFLAGSTYPDGTPVAMIAAIHNYGAPRAGIPPRPFFSNTIAQKRSEWPGAVQGLLKANNFDTKKTLQLMGEAIKSQIQQGIRDTNSPPLKPATIRRKGFSKPLISSGQLINSVNYEVTD